MPDRHFLFLQGMPGPSLRLIARELRRLGQRTSRVNFNGGDLFDWRGRGYNFRSRLPEFESWLRRLIERAGVTDLVLFGAERPYHRIAAQVAAAAQLDLHLIEEGYIRPDSVTVETWPGGVRWQPAKSLEECAARVPPGPSPAAEARPIANSYNRRANEAIRYWIAAIIAALCFPHYRTHRLHGPVREIFARLKRRARRASELKSSSAALARLGAARYFLFPLQLDGDAQIVHRSRFASMAEAARQVMASFAEFAPGDTHLLVKRHPFDPGATDWRSAIERMAYELGLDRRVHFIEWGDLDRLIARCKGVVTVNSTVGVRALEFDRPVHPLGEASYAIGGLADLRPLADFWRSPETPRNGAYTVFAKALWSECLVNGGFHDTEALAMLAQGAARKMLGIEA